MPTVNMHQAKSGLSKLVADIESGAEQEVILARNGKPVARIVPIAPATPKRRLLGMADGEFGELGEDWYQGFQAMDQEVIDAFEDRLERLDLSYAQLKKSKHSP